MPTPDSAKVREQPHAVGPYRIRAADTAIGLETFDQEQPGVEMIVDGMLPVDVAMVIAPGGTGKSTVLTQVGANTVLGQPVFGKTVLRPGPVVLLTAEDGLPRIRHRLQRMANQMALLRPDVERLARDLHVVDLSAMPARLACLDKQGNIVGTALVDAIIDAYRDIRPSVVILDPLVAFGPGERHVNDGEQAVIVAMRRMVAGLNAAVIGIHHTGKAAARDKTIDLYSGRGGSALGDGARAVFVMELVEGETVPVGLDPTDVAERRLFRLHNAKLTDAPRWREPLTLLRHGMTFREVAVGPVDAEAGLMADVRLVCDYVRSEAAAGRRHCPTSVAAAFKIVGLPRDRVRDTIPWAVTRGNLAEVDLPKAEARGRRKHYLQVVEKG